MSFDEQRTVEQRNGRPSSPRPARPPGEPATSVIITNYNYGHFLADCIDSVLAQVRHADQIIVVDDGSTDASREVLARYGDEVEIVFGENAGQAAAFNRGFSLASGEVVVFLDADDRLREEALEVILAHWSPDLALLAYGLETIDAVGRSTGAHPFSLRADDGDNRPRLLRTGSIAGPFAFAPTSGNAFNRRFLEKALPMNEAAWRICADAYLVRAAALAGRFGAIPRVLGSYRTHGGNNYLRCDTFDAWSMKRGLRDLDVSARALETLAGDARLLAEDERRDAIRVALRLRAIETRAHIAVWNRDFALFGRQLRACIRGVLTARLPIGQRIAAAASIARFGLAARSTRRLCDPLLGEGAGAPRPLRGAPGARGLEASLAALERPRWPEAVPYGKRLCFDRRGPHQNILADGWSGFANDGRCWSNGAKAALDFVLEPAPGPIAFEIGLGLPEGEPPARFAVTAGGVRVWTGDVAGQGTAAFTLDRDAHDPLQPVRIEIECARHERLRDRLRGSRARFCLIHLSATERAPAAIHPTLAAGEATRAAALVAGAQTPGWDSEADGSALLRGAEATLGITVVPMRGRSELEAVTRSDSGTGWLRVRHGDDDLFTGWTGPGRAIRFRLPDAPAADASRFTLSIAFDPADPDRDRLALATIRLLAAGRPDEAAPVLHLAGHGAPPLSPGQVVFFAGNPSATAFLLDGWEFGEEGGARTAATEAGLALALPEGVEDPALNLFLRPALTPGPQARHVVAVSVGGEMLQSAEVLGEGEIRLALPRCAGPVEITLHSIFVPASPSGSEAPRHAAVELISLGLDGREERQVPALPPPARPRPRLAALLETGAELLDAGSGADLDRLLRLRTDLARTLWGADIRALELAATLPGSLDLIERLGRACAGAALEGEAAEVAAQASALSGASEAPSDRLRALLASMLLVPAFKSGVGTAFTRLPALVLQHPDVVAAYLGREPHFDRADEMDDYLFFLEALLGGIDAVLARERPGTARRDLAVRVLLGLRSTTGLFGRADLLGAIRRRTGAIERLLVQSGARLAAPRLPRAGAGSLRLGVFVRNLRPSPEGWSVLGMYRGLDRSRFRSVLITLDRAEDDLSATGIFDDTLCLAGKSVEAAVEAIRALDLDVFVLGAYIANWETVSSIVAHRLARLQINSCFNCPSTLGFRSFDHAIAWRGAGEPGAQRQYTERLVEIDAPLQCCFDFGEVAAPSPEPAALRRELGLPADAILLVSGAMAHKIQPELMRAWAEILAAAPRSRLVLYPFARWWSMGFAPEIFRRKLNAHLAACGVATDRAVVLPEQTSREVRRILASSDLYLDSFPYSGATTVCEALVSGRPVVALKGAMLRERTGAAWLDEYGVPELTAQSAVDYVAIAARLARDPDFRAEMTTRIADRADEAQPCSDFNRFGRAFSEAIWRIAGESGLLPSLGLEMPPAPAPRAPSPAEWRRRTKASPVAPSSPSRPPEPAPPPRVVVLGLARTGSTLLCDIIARSRDSLIDHELFHATEIQLRSGVIREPAAIAKRDADPVRWLQRHLDGADEAGYRLIGFKLFPHHPEAVLRHVTSGAYKLVLLTRENILAQYASFRIAEETQQWVLRPGEAPRRAAIAFEPEDFERFERVMLRLRQRLHDAVSAAPHGALMLEYRTLTEPGTTERISAFLGRDIPAFGRNEPTKQNLGLIAGRFTDQAAVRTYLASRDLLHWAEAG